MLKMELRYFDITKRELNTQRAAIREKMDKIIWYSALKIDPDFRKTQKAFFFNVRTSRKSWNRGHYDFSFNLISHTGVNSYVAEFLLWLKLLLHIWSNGYMIQTLWCPWQSSEGQKSALGIFCGKNMFVLCEPSGVLISHLFFLSLHSPPLLAHTPCIDWLVGRNIVVEGGHVEQPGHLRVQEMMWDFLLGSLIRFIIFH